MTTGIDKILDRVRKLLKLSEATSEAEAALAAQRAAELMAEYQLSEAEVRAADPAQKPEEIAQRAPCGPDDKRVVAWKGTIASAVAKSMGCRMYWSGGAIRLFGRMSATQAVAYTSQYLWSEVDRLCESAWRARTGGGPTGESARAWKGAFRVGAATRLASRLHVSACERAAADAASIAVKDPKLPATTSTALVLRRKDQEEVDSEYKAYSKGWRTGRGSSAGASSYGGYGAGQRAADGIALGVKRAGLGAGAPRLRGVGVRGETAP